MPTTESPTDPLLLEHQGLQIRLAPNLPLKPRPVIGRVQEIDLIKLAWDVNVATEDVWQILPEARPMPFKLVGPPGMGKNTMVEFVATKLEGYRFYSITGHEQLEPEDLVLSVVPRTDGERGFALHASPLLTALLTRRSIFFFDEIDRVPERTLSVLASLLDHRRALYSGIVGRWFQPTYNGNPGDLLICAALNKSSGHALPDYIDQRLLPTIAVERPSSEEMVRIVRNIAKPDEALLARFVQWYFAKGEADGVSVRQCLALLDLARRSDGTDMEKIARLFASGREN